MEAVSCPSAPIGNPWESVTTKAPFTKGSDSPECSLLTSPDLHAFFHRPSTIGSSLDVCQLASSPDSLFSPKPSQDMLLPAADSSGLFADIFPSGLLFPSPPPAAPAAAASALESHALPAAAAAARLPKKLFSTFEQLPAAAPAAVRMSDASASILQHAFSGAPAAAAAAAGTAMPAGACGAYTLLRPAAYNLMVRLEDCAPCKLPGQQETAEPVLKRQRTAFSQPNPSQEEQRPSQPASSEPLDEDCCYNDEEEEEEEDASDMEFDPSSTSEAQLGVSSAMGEYYLGHGAGSGYRAGGEGGCGRPSRLEHKRARNREAARRLRQRQRQQLSQLEEMMGSQYTTIQGLLGKLNTLTKEMKCTSQENDLLKHLLTTAAAAAAPGDSISSLGCRPGTSATAQQLPAVGLLGSSNDDEMDAVLMEGPLFGSLLQPLVSPQGPFQLPCSQQQPGSQAGVATSAGCSPAKGGTFPTGGPSSGSSRGPSAAPSPVPQPRGPAALPSSLPPSPFQSPTKQQRGIPSPSKPHTPQRPAMRSPFAGPQRRPVSRLGGALADCDYALGMAGAACAAGGEVASSAAASLLMVPVPGVAAAAPAGNAAAAKAVLLEQLAGGAGAPLAHGVVLALLQRLQERQEAELGAEAACPQVTEEEAAIIAATALQYSQGNVNAAVMQLLAWGGHAEGYPLAASQ